jgi:hypothetical protein
VTSSIHKDTHTAIEIFRHSSVIKFLWCVRAIYTKNVQGYIYAQLMQLAMLELLVAKDNILLPTFFVTPQLLGTTNEGLLTWGWVLRLRIRAKDLWTSAGPKFDAFNSRMTRVDPPMVLMLSVYETPDGLAVASASEGSPVYKIDGAVYNSGEFWFRDVRVWLRLVLQKQAATLGYCWALEPWAILALEGYYFVTPPVQCGSMGFVYFCLRSIFCSSRSPVDSSLHSLYTSHRCQHSDEIYGFWRLAYLTFKVCPPVNQYKKLFHRNRPQPLGCPTTSMEIGLVGLSEA